MAHRTCKHCGKCHSCHRRARDNAVVKARKSTVVQYNPIDYTDIFSFPTNAALDGRLSRRSSAHATLGRHGSLTRQPSVYDGKSHCQTADDPAQGYVSHNNYIHHDRNYSDYEDHVRGSVFAVKLHHRFDTATVQYNTTHVSKTVRKSHVDCDHDHVSMAVRCAQKTAQVVHSFMRETETYGWEIEVIVPELIKVRRSTCHRKSSTSLKNMLSQSNLTYNGNHKEEKSLQIALREKYVPDVHRYVSNSGWYSEANGTPEKLLVALAHYSYYWSGREFIIANVQASVKWEHKLITIVAPGLLSKYGDVYGCEDLGMKGIRNFFYWHSCNRFCNDLPKPKTTIMYFEPTSKTTNFRYDW